MFGKYTYLILDLFTIFPVLILSFDKWVKFYRSWLPAFIALVPMAIFFLVWDVYFTKWGVWEFNPDYILGVYLLNLPIEEWLFFLVVPMVCLFIYESLAFHFKNLATKWNMGWVLLTIAALLVLLLFKYTGWYTLVNAIVGIVAIIFLFLWIKPAERNLFIWMYLISLLPFALVNGVLTSEPVVIYNNAENMGLRFFSIPYEDFIYSLNLLALTFVPYVYLKKLYF